MVFQIYDFMFDTYEMMYGINQVWSVGQYQFSKILIVGEFQSSLNNNHNAKEDSLI